VAAEVFRAGVATAVPVEAGQGIGPAGLEWATENVVIGHGDSIADPDGPTRRPYRGRSAAGEAAVWKR
jgi:hypothetical protein